MKITFLGTGTSQGVPIIACNCKVCESQNKFDKRLRSSVLINCNNLNICIDTGPDFRQQMLCQNVKKLDAVLFTHEHKDHTAGLDDIRAFNYIHQKPMNIYAEERVQLSLKREFWYAFEEIKYPGVPEINFISINENDTFLIENKIEAIPIRAMHYKLPVLGYRIQNFVYLIDANYISEEEKEKMRNCSVLVINALRKETHVSHFSLAQALLLINELKPKKAYITHISHQMGLHNEVTKELPENVFLSYDGLEITMD